MKNTIYNVGTQGLDEEVFIAGMGDMISQTDPTALCGSLVVILALYVGHPVNVVTRTWPIWERQKLCVAPPKGETRDPLGSPAPTCGLTC